jgi:ADP-ribosyl-[dinitrogen reductase] hydrolase
MRAEAQRCYELLCSGYEPETSDGYPVYDECVRALIKAVHEDGGYDADYLRHYEAVKAKDVTTLTYAEVGAYLTHIVRGERFWAGHIASVIHDGVLRRLLKRYLELTATGRDAIASGIYGLAVADAVGVPAEFMRREALRPHPVTDMIGGGVHNQKPGTWSDDTSMTLCLAFSAAERNGINADDIMNRFCDWCETGAYSPHGECFDIGMTVAKALRRYAAHVPAQECGGAALTDNGNGSLMRILPLAYILMAQYGSDLTAHDEAMRCIDLVSSLTHRHPISLVACGIYILIAVRLLLGDAIADAVQRGVDAALNWYSTHDGYEEGLGCWERLRDVAAFTALPEDEIRSSGYVVDTLEAALWCLLNTKNYRECVLKAVNLGEDTDTVSAVVGGLAGIHYGLSGIPDAWLNGLQNKRMLDDCCGKLAAFTERCK